MLLNKMPEERRFARFAAASDGSGSEPSSQTIEEVTECCGFGAKLGLKMLG